MAKIKRPLNSEKARGALGGLIFSESNQVNYVRRNTVKPYEQTAKRKETAERLATSAELWASLSETDKQAWEDFAESHEVENALGQKFKRPAFSWFVSCRENLHSVKSNNRPNIIGAEIPRPTRQLITQKATTTRIQYRISESPINTDTDLRYRIYRSKEKSASRLFNISECELWTPTTLNRQGNAYAYYPEEYEYQKGVYTIFVQLVNIKSGLAGPLQKSRITME